MSRKPRIMQIVTRLIHGGAQEVVLLITRRLLREGYQVTLAHGYGEEPMLKMVPKGEPNFTQLYVPEFRREIDPLQDLAAFWRLWRYLRQHPVDLVHTHTTKAGIVGRWAARLAGVPVIIHSPRGSIYHPTYFSPATLAFFSWIERITTGFTDMVITLNESEKADYIRYRIGPPKKFTTIYSGIEMGRFQKSASVDAAAVKRELEIPENRPLVGYVARMTPEKGHTLCLRGFQKVLKEIPNALLVLVGGGTLESRVRQAAADLGLWEHVRFLGPREDVERIYPIFDCCVQTSLWDGLPRAMVEAMVSERAVVATSVGGIPEVIHHRKTGLLVSENNAEEIAQGVVELLRNPKKARVLGRNARKRMEEVFDVDVSFEKLLAMYEACLVGAVN